MQQRYTSLCRRQILEAGVAVFKSSLQGLSTMQVNFSIHTSKWIYQLFYYN